MGEESNKEERIIIRVTANISTLFEQFKIRMQPLNLLLQKKEIDSFVLESFDNGVLFIYKDLKSLQSFFLRPEKEREILHLGVTDQILNMKDVFGEVITRKTYPEEGITIHFETISGPEPEMRAVSFQFFQNLGLEWIKITPISDSKINVQFLNYEVFCDFMGHVMESIAFLLAD